MRLWTLVNRCTTAGPVEQVLIFYSDTLDDCIFLVQAFQRRLCRFYCALGMVLHMVWQNGCLLLCPSTLLPAPSESNPGELSWWRVVPTWKAGHVAFKHVLLGAPMLS